MCGNSEGWPAGQVLGEVLGAYAPADQLTKLGMGNPGASWNTPETLAAVTALDTWIKAGYFNKGVNGMTDEQAATQFANGEGLFYMTGSWQVALIAGISADGFGFIAPPPVNAGGAVNTLGGASQPYSIPTKAAHKDAAAAFINFITSDEAMSIMAATDNIPVLGAETLASGDTLLAQATTAFGEVSTKGVLLPYLDWATPTFYDDAMAPRLQDLFAGKIDPQGVIDAFEKNYVEFTS